ncbi:MAG: hypothetical protein QY322_00300 [bacterium]|nr:MAG: hypothetical protein QY322_00300 [bacterium]
MSKIFKIILFLIFAIFFLFGFSTKDVNAQCLDDCICVTSSGSEASGDCTCGGADNCSGGSSPSCTLWGDNCGGSATPPPSACPCGTTNNGSCRSCESQCNPTWVVNCPSGTVKTNNLIGSQCVSKGSIWHCNGWFQLGSAQSEGSECGCTTTPAGCGECEQYWTNPNTGRTSCIRWDCWPATTTCSGRTANTYECLSTCNTTAPSAVSFSDDLLTWTTGTNGASQNLYVSTTQSDVTNNCGTGTSCTVNANLASSTDFYPFVSPLLPDTIYFVKIVNYQSVSCSSSTNYSFLTPVANEPWWQVMDGDVTTNGVLSSLVPAGNYFLSDGLGGFSGVAVYGTSLNLYLDTPERISVNIWNANTTSTLSRIFNYSYFENLIPNDIVFNDINDLPSGGVVVDSNGYEWYKVVGNLDTVGDIDITTRKVVLFVEEGNFNINGNINLTDGVGFFASFVNGNITIDSAVSGSPAIEGIYMADNNISTGAGDTQLHLRGSLASYGSVLLERELLDNSTPAELVEFAPDQMMLFPNQLQFKRAKWAEVAP